MEVEIQVAERSARSKGEINKIRREGNIPCVIYSAGNQPESAHLCGSTFSSVLRELEPGFLPTTVFVLKDAKGKAQRAIIKDIQYNVTTYDILHLDFQALNDNMEVEVKVPVELKSQSECKGVKEGGFLRQVMRHLKVRCLPKDIPSHFELDVKNVGMRQVLRVSDITLPKGVVSIPKAGDIIVTVVKR